MTSNTKHANAFPTKRFFVDMLIKDIELHDAILDLLDNCLDGAMRTAAKQSGRDPVRPYDGFSAWIEFDQNSFCITDNCGGLPIQLAESYAFRMGRADSDRDNDLATVGVYGIGMKRAVFKLGKNTEILSRTTDGGFSVTITPDWLESDSNWELPINEQNDVLEAVGTKIFVTQLRDGIPRVFSNETDFERTLKTAISSYYGFIIEKGFKVFVNNEEIQPFKVSIIADNFDSNEGITPYIYEGNIGGVDVHITVGLYRELPNEEEEEAALIGRPSSERAGWTIVCNDRVILYADKTRVTGWGEASVPQYHTQFISIAGLVELRSNNASQLPLTTTKRGIDGNSELYLSIKDFMREGLKTFTDFTNKWKKSSKELHEINVQLSAIDPAIARANVPANKWSRVAKGVGGQRYRPNLPLPKEDDPPRQIRFSRKVSEINEVATYLFDDTSTPVGDVGAKCFDDVLRKARK
ncbi:MAG: ATP-binding protein [Glaciimonas sp.]|nr:ATP-binding protein [Glaciimonas sp.]